MGTLRVNRSRFLRAGGAGALGLRGAPVRAPPAWASNGGTALPALPAQVEPGALADLRRQLRGTLLLPGDDGYEARSAPANGRYRATRPIAVARCAGEGDVVACVRWAGQNGVPPVARGGGHSYAGFSTTTGLLLDLSRLNAVSVDRGPGTAVVGGAALNGDLLAATDRGPWFLPGGTCLGVGVGGLVLGGGIGYNAHWAGLTCDRLRASRIVTASGEVLDLDASTNSDLFWACRGGAGGSFGFNTAFAFDLVRVPPTNVTYFRFDWRGADAAGAVLSAFDEIQRTAPAALNAVAMAQPTPVGPAGARAAIDVMSRGQFIGPPGELRALLRPLLAAGPPTQMTLEERPFWDVQHVWAAAEPESHAFGDISRYATQPLPSSALNRVVDLVAACPSRTETANGAFWSLGWVGGDVINAFGRTETAYVHRNMTTLLRPTPVWEDDASPSVGDELIAWTNEVTAVIAPHTANESYQNFPNRLIYDWAAAYYAENFQRLVDVKTKYDPGNLFANPQSIPTRSLLTASSPPAIPAPAALAPAAPGGW